MKQNQLQQSQPQSEVVCAPEKQSSLSLIIQRLPQITSIIYTFVVLKFAFKQEQLFLSIMKIDPHSNSLESKIQIISRIIFGLGIIIGVLINLVIFNRLKFRTKYPSNATDPKPILFLNRLLSNSLENYIFFLGNLLFFVFCGLPTGTESENSSLIAERNIILAVVGVFYVFSRALYCILYAIGLAVDISALRAYGYLPAHILSFMLLLDNIGYKPFSSYFVPSL